MQNLDVILGATSKSCSQEMKMNTCCKKIQEKILKFDLNENKFRKQQLFDQKTDTDIKHSQV